MGDVVLVFVGKSSAVVLGLKWFSAVIVHAANRSGYDQSKERSSFFTAFICDEQNKCGVL